MINSRRKDDLTPEAYDACLRWEAQCFAIGLEVKITSTLRDQEFQDSLYEQGRSKPGPIVTWTRHSRHLPGKDGKSCAWDFVVIKDGKACWDVKVDVNENDKPDYLDAAEIARDLSCKPGADFKDSTGNPRPDYCHIETKRKS